MLNIKTKTITNYSTKSKFYHESKKIVVGKMKDETSDVAIIEFVKLKSNISSFLEDDSSEQRKQRM